MRHKGPALRPKHVAELTGLSTKTLAKYRPIGLGPRFYKLSRGLHERGGVVVYYLADVEEWLESRKVRP